MSLNALSSVEQRPEDFKSADLNGDGRRDSLLVIYQPGAAADLPPY
jgi:hypothetical protein